MKEEEKKPPFIGVMNGITFKKSIEAEDAGFPDCHPTDVPEDEIGDTPLRLKPGYVPAGLELTGVYASACDGTVFNVATEYFGAGKSVRIYTKTFAMAITTTPAERVQAVTVAGKPAVLIIEPPAVGSKHDGSDVPLRLLILEAFGLTEIRTAGVAQEEIFKIADGLQ